MTFITCALNHAAVADEIDPKIPSTVPGSIASNQPLQVDSADSTTSAAATEQPAVQEPPPSPIVSESNEAKQENAPKFTGSMLVRRSREVADSNPQTTQDQRPWYRSTLFSLSVVLTLIGAAYWGVRKLVPSMRAPQRSELIRVLARTALTPKQHVALVQCGKRVVLVGVSPDRVETLSEITDPTEVSELTMVESGGDRKAVATGAFGQWFDKERDTYTEPIDAVRDAATEDGAATQIRSSSKTTRPPLKELLERVRSLST